MKTIIQSFLLAAMFCLPFTTTTNAQGNDMGYVTVDYMKVKPGQMADYLACEKAWKHIHKERIRQGHITGWEMERVMYPGGTNSEYDFLTITFFKSWEAMGAAEFNMDELIKSVPEDQRELVKNTSQYRDMVKREIWRGVDIVAPEGGMGRPKYRVENFFKISPGGWDDYMELERRFVKPIHEKSVAAGNRAGWVLGSLVFPRGAGLPYQVSSVDFFNSWDDMTKSDKQQWDEVYPNMSRAHIGRRITSTRTLVRSELRELVDYVE